jgi:hypothetical protein
MTSPLTAPPAPSRLPPTGGPAKFHAWFHRLEDRFFPPLSGPTTNRRGVLSSDLRDWPGVVTALAIGVVVAALIERAMLVMPVPAGGDPGQWTSTSYAYVGLPYPSWIVPGQYPPMLFPLLGLLVRIMGGPIGGARAYVAVVAVLLGLSTYFLARGLTRRRSTALMAEALVLLNPTFLQMFFWGFYPNLLGLVFLNLALGFFVRYLRSRRPLHVVMFWLCAAATILSHSLVGVILVGVVGVVFLLALSIKAIPREIYRSKASLGGLLVFLVSVGGFYASTALLKIPHPEYLQSGAFAYVRNGISAIFNLLLQPWIHGLTVNTAGALALLGIFGVGIGLYAIGMRLFWKNRLTIGTMVTLGLALSPLLLAGVGWEFSVVTDYGRFSYFLVAPLGIAIALVLDRFMTELNLRAPPPRPPTPTGSVAPRWYPGGRRTDVPVATAVITLFAIVVVLLGDTVSVRSLPKDELATTKVGHDSTFLGALNLIQSSGIQGNLLTVPGVAKWSRALLVRDAYFPNLAARYTFDPTHLIDEETAYFALTSRYAATNGVVAVTALGTNLSSGNDTFEYQPAYFGVFTPVAALPIGQVTVRVVPIGAPLVDAVTEPVTSGGTVRLTPAGASSYSMSYIGTGFVLTITAVAIPGAPEATILVNAVADPTYHLLALHANLTSTSRGAFKFTRGTTNGTINIVPAKYGTYLASTAQVEPASDLGPVEPHNIGNTSAYGTLVAESSGGASQLSFGVTLSTPRASNLVSGLAPLITTDTVWANWTIRFVLYTNSKADEGGELQILLANEVNYLEAEYGARVLGVSGTWTVLLVPGAGFLPVGPRPALLTSGPPNDGGGPSPDLGPGAN